MADKPIDLTIEYLESKIETLESRNAFQDDVIEQLNHELAIHQSQIGELKAQLQLLAKRIKESNQQTGISRPEDEPPPPHY
ncbi:SlyX family protein [Thalassotalea ganghwensis]